MTTVRNNDLDEAGSATKVLERPRALLDHAPARDARSTGRYVNGALRHRALLCVPILIGLLGGSAFAMRQPRQYMSVATLWADARIPNESTVLATPDPTPAAQEAGVLGEMLTTRAFLFKVANDPSSRAFVKDAPVDEAMLAGVAKSIAVRTPGPQAIAVSVTAKSPAAAKGLGEAVVKTFGTELVGSLRSRDQALVDYYQRRLNGATENLNTAQEQLTAYTRSLPAGSSGVDHTASLLQGNLAASQERYSGVNDKLNEAELSLATVADSSILRVVDQPNLPSSPQGRIKNLIFAGGGGLMVGLLISLFLLIYFVAVDVSIREASDIEDGLGLQVVGSVDQYTGRRRDRGTA